jgi:hypothetical protein
MRCLSLFKTFLSLLDVSQINFLINSFHIAISEDPPKQRGKPIKWDIGNRIVSFLRSRFQTRFRMNRLTVRWSPQRTLAKSHRYQKLQEEGGVVPLFRVSMTPWHHVPPRPRNRPYPKNSISYHNDFCRSSCIILVG